MRIQAGVLMIPVVLLLLYFAIRPSPMCLRPSFAPQGARGDLLRVRSALNEFAILNGGDYPERLEQLLEPNQSGEPVVTSREELLDPWEQQLRYESSRELLDLRGRASEQFYLFTLGRDNQPGGTGKNEDLWITAWGEPEDF